MKILQVILFIIILITPIGISSVVSLTDDTLACELFESIEGEEEGDDSEEKGLKETEFFKTNYISIEKNDVLLENLITEYVEFLQFSHNIVLEVQTPPPENTMC